MCKRLGEYIRMTTKNTDACDYGAGYTLHRLDVFASQGHYHAALNVCRHNAMICLFSRSLCFSRDALHETR